MLLSVCVLCSAAHGEDLPFASEPTNADACALEASICEASPASDSPLDMDRFEASSRDQTIYKEISGNKLYVTVFYTYDCPHCLEAITFLTALKGVRSECAQCQAALGYLESTKRYETELVIRAYEVKKNPDNMRLFKKYADAYNTTIQGVPMIFIGNKFYVGYRMGSSCRMLAQEIARQLGEHADDDENKIDVPFIGEVDVSNVSLLQFTIVLGLLDGFNPCAMWVLMFLLGLLVYSRSRRRILLIGVVFVAASGLVYFAFMAAWFNLFRIIGLSSLLIKVLAVIAMTMGLINLKDVFFFKKGISLMIPESAKSSLYRKTRAILHEQQTFLAICGTVLLAIFVNFIELACTIGLPAIFTKILSERDVSVTQKYLYLIGYNVAYIIPLLVIVLLFAITLGHFKMNEKHAKILKLLSGILMLTLGLLLLLKPQWLIIS